ncbi:DnaD domain protein [Sporomusa malonica]|uniref:DnaD and phage-associated domain-containing protein n=1 Tax=Sporomusa malonica TaxID=112901 RepID=A0A1W2AV14_9FIRM|nr:DnaD domain protein [Sporomusa malonica]SMC64028.1 DnaD and phage-associated domain-containing protein [Sporomusa malonica]
MKWFRLYSEIKDDPKMLALTDHQFRIWINLLAMASDMPPDSRGTIPRFPFRGLATSLHTTEDQLKEALDLFASEEFNLIQRQDDGSIFVTKFLDRQYEKASDTPDATRERKRKQRSREQNNPVTSSHADVTPSHALYTDTDTDTENIKDDDDNSAGAREVFSLYQNEVGIVSSTVAQFIADAVDTYSPEWVKAAICEAVKHNARNWSYIDACLKNWKVHGFGVRKPDKQSTKQSADSVNIGPPNADQAWLEVSSQIEESKRDPTKRLKWSHNKIDNAVKLVSLRVLLGQFSIEDKKDQFIKAYQGGG